MSSLCCKQNHTFSSSVSINRILIQHYLQRECVLFKRSIRSSRKLWGGTAWRSHCRYLGVFQSKQTSSFRECSLIVVLTPGTEVYEQVESQAGMHEIPDACSPGFILSQPSGLEGNQETEGDKMEWHSVFGNWVNVASCAPCWPPQTMCCQSSPFLFVWEDWKWETTRKKKKMKSG